MSGTDILTAINKRIKNGNNSKKYRLGPNSSDYSSADNVGEGSVCVNYGNTKYVCTG